MPRIVWGRVGDRRYENGLDRGVLYLPDGSAVPWNGLTGVDQRNTVESAPVYFDGVKIHDIVTPGDFSGTLRAVTYPDEFVDVEGAVHIRRGVVAWDQTPQMFGLSYRTMIGDGVSGIEHYKVHIISNLTAVPSDRSYNSISDSPELVEFEWDLNAVPTELPGVRPTAHLTLDSREIDEWLLEEVEGMLYGSTSTVAEMPSFFDLFAYISDWYRVKIIDNGDGTWSAVERRPGFISVNDAGWFEITKVNAAYLDEDTFEISDTLDIVEAARVDVRDNFDGTWTASTDSDNVIEIDSDGIFQIRSVDPVFAGPDMYRLSDTNGT